MTCEDDRVKTIVGPMVAKLLLLLLPPFFARANCSSASEEKHQGFKKENNKQCVTTVQYWLHVLFNIT